MKRELVKLGKSGIMACLFVAACTLQSCDKDDFGGGPANNQGVDTPVDDPIDVPVDEESEENMGPTAFVFEALDLQSA